MSTRKMGQQARRRRGPGVLIRVTWPMLAEVFGVSIHTVKKWGTGKGKRFDPRDLGSVLNFARERRTKD